MGKIYTGVSNLAKQVSKIYAGVGGVAKQISKVYAGDEDGIARLVYYPFITYLIQDGVSVNETLTGGWQRRATTLGQGGTAYNPSVSMPYTSKNYARIYIGTNSCGIVEIVNDIDLSNYNKIVLFGRHAAGGNGKLCVIDRLENSIVVSISLSDSQSNQRLDVSNLSGSYDICILVKGTDSNSIVYAYNLWLE